MKAQYPIALALLAGFGLGAVADQGLRAEAKPPAYYISEIVVRDLDPYLKDYLPMVKASVEAFGGKSLAGGDKIIPIEGDPPKASRRACRVRQPRPAHGLAEFSPIQGEPQDQRQIRDGRGLCRRGRHGLAALLTDAARDTACCSGRRRNTGRSSSDIRHNLPDGAAAR